MFKRTSCGIDKSSQDIPSALDLNPASFIVALSFVLFQEVCRTEKIGPSNYLKQGGEEQMSNQAARFEVCCALVLLVRVVITKTIRQKPPDPTRRSRKRGL